MNRARNGGLKSSRVRQLLLFWYRQAQRLFHVLVGLTFLFLAFAGAGVAWSEWRLYTRHPGVGLLRFNLIAGFTVLLLIFCLYSFARARSVK